MIIFGMIHDPRIVAYSHDKKLRVWNTTTGVCEHVLAGHTESPSWGSPCVISRDNQLIGSVIHNGETKIWNINTGQCLKTIPTISSPTENVYRRMKICYLSAERLVWWHASGTEFEVGVWNVRSDTAEYILPVKAQFVTVSAGGKYLMILEAGKDESMRVYSFDTENLNEIK
jgi:WD40 repeat protein